MKLKLMNGYKLFKETDDNLHVLRIIKTDEDKNGALTLTVRDEATGNIKTISNTTELKVLESYTPLEPDAIMTFTIVTVDTDVKDVVVTASKFLNVKIGDTRPHVVCRQCINDFFYDMIGYNMESDQYGVSVSQDTCPADFDFNVILGCKSVEFSYFVNFYRNDSVEDVLNMIPLLKFNSVLRNLFNAHMNSLKIPMMKSNKLNQHKGWCKDLPTLLKINNFEFDVDSMLNITAVDFNISDYIVKGKTEEDYDTVTNELKEWLSFNYKININSVAILKYDNDINVAEYKDTKYLFLRDSNKDLYMIIYTTDKDYFGSDLEKELEKKDFSTEFRINFYNKYNKNNK